MAKKEIFQIDSVSVSVLSKTLIQISVKGKASSKKWTAPDLKSFVYVHNPIDSIQDYSFLAEPPTGIVPQMLTDISVTKTLPLKAWMLGVRIHATSNTKTVKFTSLQLTQKQVEDAGKLKVDQKKIDPLKKPSRPAAKKK